MFGKKTKKSKEVAKTSAHSKRVECSNSQMPKARAKKSEQPHRYYKNVIKAAQFDISPRDFSRNALTVVEKLQRQGFEAYIVGGCIRDLLLGKKPKDFDVATNARP